MKIALVFNRMTKLSVAQGEFDSPETIQDVKRTLESGGHFVTEIEATLGSSWICELERTAPDLIFNMAEGHHGVGRESLGPALFDHLGIAYVGSGPDACLTTLDKWLTKAIAHSIGIPVSEGFLIRSPEELRGAISQAPLPAFIKPNFEGSSKGIDPRSICHSREELRSFGTQSLRKFPHGILIEHFIPGHDIAVPYVAGLGDEEGVLEPFEYLWDRRDDGIYDFELKNELAHRVRLRCPARLKPAIRTTLVTMMKRLVQVLRILDFARADFRLDANGSVFFLEMNALPGLQRDAGLFRSSRRLGLDYRNTILHVLDSAARRWTPSPGRRHYPQPMCRTPRIGLIYNLRRDTATDNGILEPGEPDSQSTVDDLRSTVERLGYPVVPIEFSDRLAEHLLAEKIDVVLNYSAGLHRRTREAQVPAVCDLLGIEHTGSDATCLAIALDKTACKKIVMHDGLLAPRGGLYDGKARIALDGPRFPLIVKPNYEGSSKGIDERAVVHNPRQLHARLRYLWRSFAQPILYEEYIAGQELTGAILDNGHLRAVGPLEWVFTKRAGKFPVFSYPIKRSNRLDLFLHAIFPARLARGTSQKVRAYARRAFQSRGCRDIARVDFRVDDRCRVYFLEINPIPGLSQSSSDLPLLMRLSGTSYKELIRFILLRAISRWRQRSRREEPRPLRD